MHCKSQEKKLKENCLRSIMKIIRHPLNHFLKEITINQSVDNNVTSHFIKSFGVIIGHEENSKSGRVIKMTCDVIMQRDKSALYGTAGTKPN